MSCMKKLLLTLSALFCVYACSSDDSSSAKPTPEGFAGHATLYAYLDQTPVTTTQDECPDWHTEIDTAIDVRLPSLQYNLKIYFWCHTEEYYPDCGYEDVHIKVDGKPVENEFAFFYERDTSLKIVLPDFENEHVIEWSLDSAQCGNFHAKYRLAPSKKPGDYVILGEYRQEESNRVKGPSIFKKGKLFFDIESHYRHATFDWEYEYAYVDSAQSDCIIEKDGDTLHLPLKVLERESERRRPDIRVEADSAKLVDFLGADTTAEVLCALVYQSWIVPKEVDSLQYDFTIKYIEMVQNYNDRLEDIDCVNDAPCFVGEFARWIFTEGKWHYNPNTYLLAKTAKGNLVYKQKGLSWCSPDNYCRYIFTRKDLPIDTNGDTLELEYLQLVAFPEGLASNWDTWRIGNALDSIYGLDGRSRLDYIIAGKDPDSAQVESLGEWYADEESAVKIDSMMNILIDKDGNPKEGLWIMAKRLNFKQD